MEAAWLGQLAAWIERLTREPVSWPLFLLLLVLAAGSTRLLLSSSWPLARVRLLGAALAVVSVTALVPRFGLGLALAAVAWYRGVGIGRSPMLIDDVFGYFTMGSIALVVLGLFRAAWPEAAPAGSGTIPVLAFFGAGLVALALARLELLRRRRPAGDEAPPAVGRQWMGLLTLTSFGVLGVSVLLAGLVSFQVLADLTGLLGSALRLLFLVIIALALPLVFLMEQLVYGVRWLLAALGIVPEPVQPRPPEPLDFQELQEQAENGGLPPEVIVLGQFVGIGLLAAVAIIVLVLALFRYRASQEQAVEEERESVWSWRDAWAGIVLGLKSLWDRLLRRSWPASALGGTYRWAEPSEPAARTVRETYRALLHWAAQRGLPRRTEQTPYEFLGALTDALPEAGQEAAAITAAYVPVRYAQGPVERGLVREAEAAWERLRER